MNGSKDTIEIFAESTKYKIYDFAYTRRRDWDTSMDDEAKNTRDSTIGLPFKLLKDLEAVTMIDESAR